MDKDDSNKLIVSKKLEVSVSTEFPQMWSPFSDDKRKISMCGAILLNQEATKMILCQVWNGNAWTFPAFQPARSIKANGESKRRCERPTKKRVFIRVAHFGNVNSGVKAIHSARLRGRLH
jgi:hypothetical protein